MHVYTICPSKKIAELIEILDMSKEERNIKIYSRIKEVSEVDGTQGAFISKKSESLSKSV